MQFPLTILFPQWETTDILAHGHEAVEVLLQALICLLLQSRDGSELGPVKDLFLLVIDNPKGGDSAVEICLLPPGPPVGQGGDVNTSETCSGPSMGKAPGREAQRRLSSYCPPVLGSCQEEHTRDITTT